MSGLRMHENGTLRLDGLGDWKSALSMMIAEGELNRLLSAVFQLNDQLRGLVESRNGIYDGYAVAKKLYDEAVSKAGGAFDYVFGATVPKPEVLPSLQSLATTKIGIEQFARQVSTILQLVKVFNSVAVTLQGAGMTQDSDNVSLTVNQVNKFVYDTDNKFAGVPEYSAMKSKIMSAALAEWKAWGISSDDTSNPWWFQAFIKAAQRVCPVDGDQWPPPGFAGTGMGALTVLAQVILWVVGIIATAVTIMYSISKLIAAMNSKAETAKQLILDRNAQKEQLRAQMVAAGKSQADINAAMAAFDAETKKQVADIPESSIGGTLTMIAALAAAAFIVPSLIGGRR